MFRILAAWTLLLVADVVHCTPDCLLFWSVSTHKICICFLTRVTYMVLLWLHWQICLFRIICWLASESCRPTWPCGHRPRIWLFSPVLCSLIAVVGGAYMSHCLACNGLLPSCMQSVDRPSEQEKVRMAKSIVKACPVLAGKEGARYVKRRVIILLILKSH